MAATLTWTKDGIHATTPTNIKPTNLAKAQAEADAYLAKHPQDRAIIERSLAALAARASK